MPPGDALAAAPVPARTAASAAVPAVACAAARTVAPVVASAAAHTAAPVASVAAPVAACSATPAAAPGIALENLSPDVASEIIGLRSEYPTCFGYALLLTFSLFLAQVFARTQELRAIRDAAAHVAAHGPSKVCVPRPAKLGTLREDMGISHNEYKTFWVGFLFFLSSSCD